MEIQQYQKTTNLLLRKSPFARLASTVQYRKTCLKLPLKKNTKIGFQDRLSLNAGQKYCRMLQQEHSAILSTFIKLPFVIKICVLSIFEWPLKTGFTVLNHMYSFREIYRDQAGPEF